MNVLLVHGLDISKWPPVRNLIELLLENGHNVTVFARNVANANVKENERLKMLDIPESDAKGIFRFGPYFKRKKYIQEVVREEMKHNDVLWTTTDDTVRYLGKLVFEYKHIMQVMELSQDIPAIPGQNVIKMHIDQYARKAYKVVVPEYNRAHITQAWWQLDKTPTVLPNKMAVPEFDEVPAEVKPILDEIDKEKRKIILYQGVFYKDRNLDSFAEAIDRHEDEYCLYLMGRDTPYRQELCEKHKNIKYLSFLTPPYHLMVTQKAYIGLMPYVAGRVEHFSILNALFCAPNKIFEYAAYGVPMIGTDVPGLVMSFDKYNMGYVCTGKSADEIETLIKKVDENYENLRQGCLRFYKDTDMNKIVESILN